VKRSVKILLAATLTGFASLASAQGKIGVVNADALIQNSPQFVAAQKALNDEFDPRKKEILALQQLLIAQEEKLRKDGATMSELQLRQAEKDLRDGSGQLKLKSDQADEDFELRRDEELQKLQRLARDEIAAYAKANGFDLILVSGVGYASASFDITKPLLDSLNKKAGVSPAAGATAPVARPPAAPAAPATAPKPPAAPAK
jgi:outer membrane protein